MNSRTSLLRRLAPPVSAFASSSALIKLTAYFIPYIVISYGSLTLAGAWVGQNRNTRGNNNSNTMSSNNNNNFTSGPKRTQIVVGSGSATAPSRAAASGASANPESPR